MSISSSRAALRRRQSAPTRASLAEKILLDPLLPPEAVDECVAPIRLLALLSRRGRGDDPPPPLQILNQ
jgi:hypothetical protein